jgi:hypothetical protein
MSIDYNRYNKPDASISITPFNHHQNTTPHAALTTTNPILRHKTNHNPTNSPTTNPPPPKPEPNLLPPFKKNAAPK